MTNGWTDIRNADVVLAMGGNPAENHPVGFRFVMDGRRNRNAKLVCVDPRFNRTAAVADRFVQIRFGRITHAITIVLEQYGEVRTDIGVFGIEHLRPVIRG